MRVDRWMAAIRRLGAAFAVCAAALVGCQQQMAEQPRCGPLEPSAFFADGRCAQQPVEGTVARGDLRLDEQLYTGKMNGQLVDALPFPFTRQILERGQQRFNIYCTPCHDHLGSGLGVIVRRGFSPPPSLHIERLRQAPLGHFFEVMTNGYGTMPKYSTQISTQDRWAIAAYIRALQLSQHATLADVPDEVRQRLLGATP